MSDPSSSPKNPPPDPDDEESGEPAADEESDESAGDEESDEPQGDEESGEPAADEESDESAGDEESDEPQGDEESGEPAADEESDESAGDEESDEPQGDEESGEPAADEESDESAGDEESDEPQGDEESGEPAADEESDESAGDEESDEPQGDEESGEPAADEESDESAGDEESDEPQGDEESGEPAADEESDESAGDEESDEPQGDEESGEPAAEEEPGGSPDEETAGDPSDEESLNAAAKDADATGTGNVGDPVIPCNHRPPLAHIAAHVQDQLGNAIKGATVLVVGRGWSDATGDSGDVDFGDVPPDSYTVEVQCADYAPTSVFETKTVPGGASIIFTLKMAKMPAVELKPATVLEAGPCKSPGDKKGPGQWLGDQPNELTVTGRDFSGAARLEMQFEDDGAVAAVAAGNGKFGRKDEVLSPQERPARAEADATGNFTTAFNASRRSRGDYRLHIKSATDDVVAVLRVLPADLPSTDAQREQRYAYFLREGTRKLRDSYFGTWQGYELNELGEPTIPDFSKDRFDKEFWEWVDDDKYIRVLRSRSGKTPAEAIDAVFDRLSAWRFDCDHTVQIANLYAMRMTYGAGLFNHREGTQILLRPRESTGLIPRLHYGRQGPSEKWRIIHYFMPPDKFVFSAGYTLSLETTQLLSIAPAGSRVRWTNLAAPSHSAFRHENGVKLAGDLYAAGGIDDPITGNEFSRDALEIRLALMTATKPTWTYIHENVYIDEIEIFDR